MMLVVYGAKLKLQDTFTWTSLWQMLPSQHVLWKSCFQKCLLKSIQSFICCKDYRVSGYCLSPKIFCSKHCILETGSVTILRWNDGHCALWINRYMYMFPLAKFHVKPFVWVCVVHILICLSMSLHASMKLVNIVIAQIF
jgi:hypothetical protein